MDSVVEGLAPAPRQLAPDAVRVALVDAQPEAKYRGAALESWLRDYARAQGWPSRGPERFELAVHATGATLTSADISIFSVADSALASMVQGKRPRQPCMALAGAYDYLERAPSAAVYVVLETVAPAGPDVLALLLSGCTGVARGADLFALLEAAVRRLDDRSQQLTQRLIVGALHETLSEFQDRCWDFPFETWETIAAVAEVPRARLPLPPGTPSFVAAAAALSQYHEATGYVRDPQTARRQLSAVAKRLRALEDEQLAQMDAPLTHAEKYGLADLPRDAREFGFPQCLLPVRGCSDDGLTRLLHLATRRDSLMVKDAPHVVLSSQFYNACIRPLHRRS
jgi:hypothetical protein